MKGNVNGYVRVAGKRVFNDAIIVGNVEANSGQVELGSNARITGTLRYSSREPHKRDGAAQTNGGVETFEAPGTWRAQWMSRWARTRSGSSGCCSGEISCTYVLIY